MADVFISYKRDERRAVEAIAKELSELGLTVWFDASLRAGESFGDEIDREVRAAKAVLVCWSPGARQSRWVKAEAMIGFEQDKLVACYVAGPDKFSPATPFNASHTADLRAWLEAPGEHFAAWRRVLQRIGKLCARADIEHTAAIQLNPRDADAFKARGVVHDEMGNDGSALADYTEAIRLNPQDAEAFRHRAGLREYLDDLKGALSDYTEAIRLDPNDVEALTWRAVLYCRSSETYSLAIDDYSEVIRIEPNEEMLRSRALLYEQLGEHALAISDYTAAIRLDPSNKLDFVARGDAYSALEDYARAIDDYTEAIALDSSCAWAFKGRGAAYSKLEEYQRAMADYNEAIRLDPTNADFLIHRAVAFLDMGDEARSEADHERARQLWGLNDA